MADATKKIRVGWFSYSCCEDSTIMFTEIMNDHWQDWKKIIDFRHARVLQSKNHWDEMDVAFIEGAVANDHQKQEVLRIRSLAKKVVAIGACACTGMPSAQRNTFNEKQKEEIEILRVRFASLPMVLKLSDVIKIDAEVPGCPMDTKKFLETLTALVGEWQAAQ